MLNKAGCSKEASALLFFGGWPLLDLLQMGEGIEWIQGMSNAIDYMGTHLPEPTNFDEIAKQAGSSTFHLMRSCECSISLINVSCC
mgnify:FL=1